MEQIHAIWLIILYLIAFQTIVLGVFLTQALLIAFGITLVVVGLAFFMEGLFLGLMPLGEAIGIKLPQKSKLSTILIFSFVLGFGATFAEPTIAVLKAAGSSVKAWDAPLLFLLLNKYSNYLVCSICAGVGIAVIIGMLRFIYFWSLKPMIYIAIILLTCFSIYASLDSNLVNILGLAWDCGAITTGEVTVPLIIALGVGITKVVSKGGDGNTGGFGVITLASAIPIITVLLLGISLLGNVSKPMQQEDFFTKENISKAEFIFENKEQMIGYMFLNANKQTLINYFGSQENINTYLSNLKTNNNLNAVFGNTKNFDKWFIDLASPDERSAVYEADAKAKLIEMMDTFDEHINIYASFQKNFYLALEAIIPLSIFLFFVLIVVLREKPKKAKEIAIGLIFAIFGLVLFGMGIEFGLSNLGNQTGSKLPVAFKSIEITDQKQTIKDFNISLLHTAIKPNGSVEKFFYAKLNEEFMAIKYNEDNYNTYTNQYIHTPIKKPIFGDENNLIGIIIVLIFAFAMGYGATLAEPALHTLGHTVEEITVGAFKKTTLIQMVALGVGIGLTMGVAKIIWNIPLLYLIIPPYLMLIFITYIATEDMVNISWDAAGVTTGPITVPLVLAIGLGVGNSVGVIEGFGMLALASAMPILTVLLMWIAKNRAATI